MTLTDNLFKCKVRLPQATHPEILALLEEKMRGTIKSVPVLEEIEMATKSAIGLFEHKGQPLIAEELNEVTTVTVPLCRIEGFYNLIPSKLYHGDLSQVAFKLLEAVEEEGEVEIIGTSFFSKDELKVFLKDRKNFLKERPFERGFRNGLLFDDGNGFGLLAPGVKVFKDLERFWRRQIEEKKIFEEVIASPDGFHPVLAKELNKSIAEWGQDSFDPFGPSDRCLVLSGQNQLLFSCISSLQFIHETFKMLELKADWVLSARDIGQIAGKEWRQELKLLEDAMASCGYAYEVDVDPNETSSPHPTIELRIHDSIGERWRGPFLSVFARESCIEFSLLGSVKRLIAILAEKDTITRVKKLES